MAELKTRPQDASVADFLNAISDETKRGDCWQLVELMQGVTGVAPRLWGSIVGFGDYRYKYASGREGDWFVVGFALRKEALTVYLAGSLGEYEELLGQLGKHKHGVGCLYIKRLSEVDLTVLRTLIERSVRWVAEHQAGQGG